MPDHPHGSVGVTAAVEVDVNDPQNEQGDKGGGNRFHKLLTMRMRPGFPGRDSYGRYEDTEIGDLPPGPPLRPIGTPCARKLRASRSPSRSPPPGTEMAARPPRE